MVTAGSERYLSIMTDGAQSLEQSNIGFLASLAWIQFKDRVGSYNMNGTIYLGELQNR